MTLTEFLEARIAEDEAVARAGISGQADPENGWGYIDTGVSRGALTPHVGIIHEPIQAAHVIRWHPARVLAECETKRAILYMSEHGLGDDYERVQRALALPYADHPSFQQEWKP